MSNEFKLIDKNTMQIMENSLGYSQLITTLTAVGRTVSKQKFYEIPFADYVPVVMGNGAFKRQIINWRTFVKGEGFKTGIMSNATSKARPEAVDAAFDELPQNILNWSKSVFWNIFELEEAMQANTLFSLIEARELARAKEWQLGIQEVAFLGVGAETGLLNNAGVSVDTSNLTKRLWNMTAAELNTWVGTVWGLYRANCAFTARASHFIIPENDFNGLCNFPDATYPIKTRIEILNDAFKLVSQNPNFKILPCAYCDKANFDGTNNRYVLLNYDESSLKMDIPIDYTMTSAGTFNGFNFENVGYGSFSGVLMQRPKEVYFFGNTAT